MSAVSAAVPVPQAIGDAVKTIGNTRGEVLVRGPYATVDDVDSNPGTITGTMDELVIQRQGKLIDTVQTPGRVTLHCLNTHLRVRCRTELD